MQATSPLLCNSWGHHPNFYTSFWNRFKIEKQAILTAAVTYLTLVTFALKDYGIVDLICKVTGCNRCFIMVHIGEIISQYRFQFSIIIIRSTYHHLIVYFERWSYWDDEICELIDVYHIASYHVLHILFCPYDYHGL